MKTPSVALTALAALSLGLVATGCGGDGSTTGGAGATGTSADRQSAAGSPGPAQCGTAGIEQKAAEQEYAGISYISCVDQPVTIWAADVDPYDWLIGGRPDDINGQNRRGPGTQVDPSAFVLSPAACIAVGVRSWGWRIGVTLADGSKASVRAQLPERGCLKRGLVGPWWPQTHFNAVNGPTSVVLTTDSGKRVKLVSKYPKDIPELKYPTKFLYTPIFIESVLKKET